MNGNTIDTPPPRPRNQTYTLYGLMLLALLCGGCGDKTDPGDTPSPAACNRVVDRIEDGRACVRDDQCPCGTSCSSGRCLAPDCEDNSACNGDEYCDAFGRCRMQDDVALVPAVQPAPQATLRVYPARVRGIRAEQPLEVVRVYAANSDAEVVRATADPGLEIKCPGSADFTTACEFSAARAEANQIEMRPVDPSAEDATLRLRIRAGASSRTVMYRVPPAAQPVTAAKLQAKWSGIATLVEHGFGDHGRAPRHSLRLPIDAKVYATTDGLRLILEDGIGWLTPVEGWHGQATLDASTTGGELRMQRIGVLDSGDNAYEVQAFAPPTPIAVSGTVLDFELRTTYDGMVLTDGLEASAGAPWTRWHITLNRGATLTDDAPAPPAEPTAPDLTFVSQDYQQLLQTLSFDGGGTILCTPSDPATVGDAFQWYTQGYVIEDEAPVLGAVSGDLGCSGSPLSVALPMLRTSDRGGSDAPSAGDLLPRCLTDVREAVWNLPSDLLFSFPTQGCVDARRSLNAAGAMASAVTRAEISPEQRARVAALMHRLLQQWFQVFSFIADEALQREALGAIARDHVGAVPTDEVVDTLTNGWDVLMFPHFATALANLPADVLAEPDYRTRYLGVPRAQLGFDAHDEQAVGLAANIVEAARRELGMAERLVLTSWRYRDAGVLDRVRALARRMIVAEAMAAGMAARAGDVGWASRYETASLAAELRLDELAAAAGGLARGDDPLGIAGRTIPIVAPAAADAVQRFSSFTRWFLGDGAGDSRVREVIQQAAGRLNDARTAFDALQAEVVRYEVDAADITERIANHKEEVGGEILRLCGDRSDLRADEILDGWTGFGGGSCYIRSEALELGGRDHYCNDLLTVAPPETLPNRTGFLPEPWQDQLGNDAVRFQFCRTQTRHGGAYFSWSSIGHRGTYNPDSPRARYREIDATCDFNEVEGPMPCSADDTKRCIRCQGIEAELVRDFLSVSSSRYAHANVEMFSEELEDSFDHVTQTCRSATGYNSSTLKSIDELQQAANDKNFDAWVNSNAFSRSDRGVDAPNYGACLRPGDDDSIAAALLDALTASTEVDIARRGVDELLESYEIAVDSCASLESSADKQFKAYMEFEQQFDRLRTTQDIFHAAAAAAGGIADCAGAVGGAGSSLTGAGAAGVQCGAVAIRAAAEIGEQLAASGIERLGVEHEATVAAIQASAEVDVCFREADFHLVGMQAARLRVETAMFQLQRAVLQVSARKRSAQRIWEAGHARLDELEGRTVRPIADNAWLDQDIVAYVDRMERARRYTYLAVIAAEYERQQTLGGLRTDALQADYPEDLEIVVSDLEDSVNAPGIGGALPSTLDLVLRMRRDVLQFLGADGPAQDGELPLDNVQRFRMYLQSPRFAVFEGGEYKGQRIPFSLAPLEALALGDAGAIPAFTDGACAERLWSVNVTITGSDDLFFGEGNPACSESRCNLELEKRNTFYSQWCTSGPTAGEFQLASYLPSANVFTLLNPGADYEAEGFSVARVDSALNQSFEAFGAPDAPSGSEELRGRGLYGDYALFIPKDAISWRDSDGSRTSGIVLDEVDDVLVRLEYTSVAK